MIRTDRYTTVAIWLHWLIAAMIITNIALGFGHEWVDRDTGRQMIWWHKPIGLTVLMLSFVRLWWRLTHKPPPLPAAMPQWERFLASATHWLFYALMIGMPIGGWLFMSASPRNTPISYFGLFDWPFLPVHSLADDQRKAVFDSFKELHEIGGYMMLGLLVLHVAAALKHIFINRDEVGHHMIPALRPGHNSDAGGDRLA
ncbi:MAG: cytochrome b [Caulobacteraceae bacterium]